MFICHLHLRNSVAGFAENWLASLLYICHAVFTLSKIRSSCHWSLSSVVKKKKIMPNHLEDIKCQQAEGKKNHLLCFLMIPLLHLIFVCVLFLRPLGKKKILEQFFL